MPQLYHFVAEQFKENLVLGSGGQYQRQHMVAGRLCQYLKHWQLEGLRFLYKNHEKSEGCILNDESGLGKVVTVATFLGSILTNDTTKKCLIVCRDEAAIEEWRFHLSVLTHLIVKVIEKTSDINFETVYLIKWSSIKDIIDIDKLNFDHVILDNRGEMLKNKFCTGILLRYFENKVTIIISSVDVTSDIKLLHILLRLCGRLERQYTDAKVFEDKFELPQLQEGVSNKVDLEDYFVKRERVINFCRDFRLRRYCHQFDEEFPIVSRGIFQRHLQQWQNQNKSSLSSGSVKQERKDSINNSRLDYEVERINETPYIINNDDEDENSSDDVVVMSPLVLVSESESDEENDRSRLENERNSQFIEEIKDEDTDDDDDDKGDRRNQTSKDSTNTSATNRRKSKTPVKTPSKSNNKRPHPDDSKSLRSRTLTSPKKPLPIRKNSKKSPETPKHNKDNETINKRQQENNKKTVENGEAKKKAKDNDETPKKSPSKQISQPKSNGSVSKDKKSNQNDTNFDNLEKSESIQETQTPTRKDKVKLKSIRQKRNEVPEKRKPKEDDEVSKKLNKSTSKVDSHKKHSPNNESIQEKKIENNNKLDQVPKIVAKSCKSNLSIMMEEAQKFVTNENIGRRSKKSEATKIRAKKLEVPEVVVIVKKASPSNVAKAKPSPKKQISSPSDDSKSKKVSTPSRKDSKSIQSPKEAPSNQVVNNKLKTKPPTAAKTLTELAPIGVHSISTRGMQRQTRSNPKTSKYMKISIEQVGIGKTKSPKGIVGRRRSVYVAKKTIPTPQPPKPPSKPPSPTPSAISASPEESIQLGQALTLTNNFVVPEVIVPTPRNFQYHFPLMLDKEISDTECQITSQASNNQEVIVLTGSSTNDREMEPPKSTVSVSRRKQTARPPMVTIHRPVSEKAKSPDLFSTCSDLSLPCSQQQHSNKTNFEGFKIFGSELRKPSPVKQQRSCLDILERMLEPRSGIVAQKNNKTPKFTLTQDKPTTSRNCLEDEDAMFEITANGTFGNTVRVNSNGEMSPIRQKNPLTPPSSSHPKNRITNYLINSSQHSSILGQALPSSLEDVADLLPKTPKRRKSLSGSAKRSPRSLSSGGATAAGRSKSTKLTQWLMKNSNVQSDVSPTKPPSAKRRRLELSFPDK